MRRLMVVGAFFFIFVVLSNCTPRQFPPQCQTTCQQGTSFCSGTGVVSCAFNPQTGCPEWQMQPCAAGQSCVSVPAPARCSAEQQCNNKYHVKKCVGQEVYWYDNCDRQREKALHCPPDTQCQGGECKKGGGCTSVCQQSDTKCTSSGWISVCVAASSGCYEWSQPIACPQGQACQNGKCDPGPCPTPCTLGQVRCEGDGIQACRKEANGCTDWGPVYPCLTGQVCKNGACVQDTCPASCSITADCDKPVCGERKACLNGVCAKPQGPCTDKCALGKTQCKGEQLQACRKEANGCTDWGPPYRCLTGQTCQNGACVQESCPGACTQDSDCQKAACGAKTACVQGICSVPPQTCPASCTQSVQCNIPACNGKIACLDGVCAQPQASCPASCTQDSQCNIPACGTKTACISGKCDAPQQSCPGSCTADAQCNIAACGTKKACVSGKCDVPQQQCPGSCTQDSQCNIPACGTKKACVSGKCDVPSSGGGWKYGTKVSFFSFPAQNSRTNSAWGPVLKDIVNHEAPGDSNKYTDLVTLGHETSHGIHAYLRNNYNKTGKKANAFYVLQNRAAIVVEPNMRKSKVAPFIPQSLRGSRYSLYITGSTAWDDRPLYIFDEWVGYFNGGSTGVDLHKLNKWTYGWRDAVMGPLEFTVYGIAVAMAVEKHDPTYFKNYTQFLEFTAWLAAESMKVFRAGQNMTNFKWTKQDTHLNNFQTAADAKPMRDFCVRVFGQKWVDNVIFGKP